MNKQLKIGVTGCIGSGKSTVCKIFTQLGAPLYDADTRAKELMISSPEIIQGIKNLFGRDAYLADGSLNKKLISDKAFYQKDLLEQLNAIVHPAVFNDFIVWCDLYASKPYIIKEAALMFESKSHTQVDQIIVVTAPEELRISRTMNRDHLSKDDVLSRMSNQFSQEEKVSRADFEIKNDENELLIPQVLKLHLLFLK